MSKAIAGANVADTSVTRQFALGQRHTAADQKEYLYIQASSAITANQAVFVEEGYTGAPITTTNGTYGGLVGVPSVSIASSSYGWVQVRGNCSLNVAASCAADVRINTTATAGRLDDDGTAGAKVVEGIKLNTACGGSAADTSAFLSLPRVAATL